MQNNIDVDAARHAQDRRRGPGIRLFSLLPISSYKAKHLSIDAQVLRELLLQCNLPATVPGPVEFQQHAERWWNLSFDLNRVTSQDRRFAFSITTDGVKAAIHVLRPRTPDLLLNDYGFAFDGSGYYRLEVTPETRVVGVDPNRGVF